MDARPGFIRLTCYALTDDFRRFTTAVLDEQRRVGLPEITSWDDSVGDAGVGADIEAPLAALVEELGAAPELSVYLHYELDSGVQGGVGHKVLGDTHVCELHTSLIVDNSHDAAAMQEFQAHCVAFVKRLMTHFPLYSSDLSPWDAGLACVPLVPVIRSAGHVAITDQSELEEYYDTPSAFLDAGWDSVSEINDRILCIRRPDLVSGPEYLSELQPHLWNLARASKPGTTRYPPPAVTDAEQPVFSSGEPTLMSVGYDQGSKTLEYSCAIESGEHVHGWEIYTLLKLVENGETSDGMPIDTIRIVFLNEETAEAEKRPLLDVGCEVHCYADNGNVKQLMESQVH